MLGCVQHFCIAAAVRGGTLRHKKFPSGESWIDQVLELLNLTDYPIEGYTMPEVLTDLHFELTGCAVDYRYTLWFCALSHTHPAGFGCLCMIEVDMFSL